MTFRAPRLAFERAVGALWFVWLVVLPLGHVTGLRNTLAVVTLVGTLALTGVSGLRDLPGRKLLIAFVAWATLSLIWSADEQASMSKLRSDLYIPLLAYAASYLYCRSVARHRLMTGAIVAGIVVLALISLLAWFPVLTIDAWLPEEHVAAIERAVPIWYPGVGDASMYVALSVGPLLAAVALNGRWRSAASLLTAVALVVVLLVSQNRNSLVVVPLALVAYFVIRSRLQSGGGGVSRRAVIAFAAPCILVAALALEVSSRERLAMLGVEPAPWGRAALELTLRDPRPRMWQEYLHLGMSHALIGVGFGRTVPSEAYATRDDAVLSQVDRAAHSHAHNLFLNIWLQLGLVGLALFAALLIALVRRAWMTARAHQDAASLGAGLLVVLLAALARELTDDFLVFAMATAFWLFLGLLFGRLAGLSDAAAQNATTPPSTAPPGSPT